MVALHGANSSGRWVCKGFDKPNGMRVVQPLFYAIWSFFERVIIFSGGVWVSFIFQRNSWEVVLCLGLWQAQSILQWVYNGEKAFKDVMDVWECRGCRFWSNICLCNIVMMCWNGTLLQCSSVHVVVCGCSLNVWRSHKRQTLLQWMLGIASYARIVARVWVCCCWLSCRSHEVHVIIFTLSLAPTSDTRWSWQGLVRYTVWCPWAGW